MIRTNFANGIIYIPQEKEKPLMYDGTYVSIQNLKKPISVTLSHGPNNYYIELSNKKNVWEITNSSKKWLCVRLNNFSAELEFVVLDNSPDNKFGKEFPHNPAINDLFFNISLNRFFYWDGYKWINIVQVTIATIENGIINLKNPGTQVGINSITTSNKIYKENNKVIRNIDENGYYYFSVHIPTINNNEKNKFKNISLKNSISFNVAAEYIPAFSLVSLDENSKIVLADSENRVAYAMCIEECNINEVCKIVHSGEVFNRNWSFDTQNIENQSKLFLSSSGQFDTHLQNNNIIQQVATIICKNKINLKIIEPIFFVTL